MEVNRSLHFAPLCLCAFVPCVKALMNFKPAYAAKHLPRFIEKIPSMIKILIIDDHAIVRKGLKQIVEDTSDMVVAGEAGNGAEALALIRRKDWDVVILDIAMPGREGIETLKDMKAEKPGIPVIILSIHPEEQYAIRALKAGASGYLTKETAPEALIQAIRKVCRGGRYISATLAETLACRIGADSENRSMKSFPTANMR